MLVLSLVSVRFLVSVMVMTVIHLLVWRGNNFTCRAAMSELARPGWVLPVCFVKEISTN